MYKVCVVTDWVGSGRKRDAYRPRIDEYPHAGRTDLTGQDFVTEPNEFCVEITCDQATLDAIEDDPNCEVLWTEEIERERHRPQKERPKESKPRSDDKRGVRQRLQAKGVDERTAKYVTGENEEELTCEEVAQRRIEWQRGLPKA